MMPWYALVISRFTCHIADLTTTAAESLVAL